MSESHPPLGGIHEAAVYTCDLDVAERFWSELGLELIGRAEGRHVFFRLGHDVLLVFDPATTLTAGGRVPSHGALGPTHVAFDIPDRDALEAWRKRLDEVGIDVEAELEWPSGDLSLYFRDPDHNSIEFITRGAWG